MLASLALFVVFGGAAGMLAGLLGVGGGLIIVPMITYAFSIQGISGPYTYHMALGTSLATIMFTSVSSFMAHHRNKAVIWSIVKQITPGILLGVLIGAKIASRLPMSWLKAFFVVFLLYVGTQMLLDIKPKAARRIPGLSGNSLAGGIIGMVSSFVGIGGGTLSVPYMVWCNVPMHKAIGTSAAIGFPIAIAGAVGYLWNGLATQGLMPEFFSFSSFAGELFRNALGQIREDHAVGFIYLPALIGIASASVLTAPFGARLAHRLPVKKLKKFFAYLLFIIAAQMSYGILTQ